MNKYDSVSLYYPGYPLKPELWKKANEIFCLSILRVIFYPKFENFLLSDSPDLISDDFKCGIEVTQAITEKDAQVIGAYVKNNHTDDKILQEKCQKIIEKNGVEYCYGMLNCGVRDEESFLIPFRNVVVKKIGKIERYKNKKLDKLGLIVYAETSILPGHSKTWIDVYNEIAGEKTAYDFVYFLYIYGIDYYDPINKVFETYDISQADFEYLCMMGRMISENVLTFNSQEWKDLI